MNNIQILNSQEILGKKFTVYGDIENPLFLAKDVAEMIEHSNPRMMLKSVDEDEKQCVNNPYASQGQQEQWFLTEYGLYEILMQSRKPIAKQFKKEVKAMLKQLRTTGVVITESATQEAIDYQSKYGTYRIRKTFENTNDIRAEYEQYFELSKLECKVHRTDNKTRINGSKIIIDVIQNKIANEVQDMRPSELLGLQELINDIQVDIRELDNRRNGGIKSGQTKKINNLEQELEQWKVYAEGLEEYYNPIRTWYELPVHGFSTNYMFDGNHNATKDYAGWLDRFPEHLLPSKEELEAQGVSFDNRNIVIELGFIHCESYDVDNLVKSAIDVIFGHHLKVNDNLIIKAIPTTIATCDSKKQGEIHFCIYNTEEVPHINKDTLYRVINGQVEILGHKN